MSVEYDANDVTIDAHSGLSGVVEIGRDLLGSIEIAGFSALSSNLEGEIYVGRNVAQTDANLPAIHMHGSLIGQPGQDPEDPMIEVVGELDGIIAVDGSLNNAVNGPEIHVGSIDLNNLGAIAIDYDGDQELDSWKANAAVMVDSTSYSGNTPGARIYEITCEKGDMNNDGITNASDTDAFITAVGDMEEYGEDYPGLLGSGIYHGDFTCDGYVNSYDIDGYIARLGDPDTCVTCEEGDCNNCGDGGGERGGDPLEPAEVAALFGDYVAPVRLPLVIEIVADLADYHADTPQGEFWEAVLAELG